MICFSDRIVDSCSILFTTLDTVENVDYKLQLCCK